MADEDSMSAKESADYRVPAVDRALDVLLFMADNPEPIGAREMALRLGYPHNSVFRILRTLERRGFVERRVRGGGYVLTPMVCVVGSKVANRFRLMDVAQPVMNELARRTRETVQLFVPFDGAALLLAQVESMEPVKISGHVGCMYDLHCSAAGKVFLADLSEAEFQRVLDARGSVRRTFGTISGIMSLRAEVAHIRERGYAVDDQEYGVGIRCAAAPIRDYRGAVTAALCISGPVARIDDSGLRALSTYVVEAAALVSNSLGAGMK